MRYKLQCLGAWMSTFGPLKPVNRTRTESYDSRKNSQVSHRSKPTQPSSIPSPTPKKIKKKYIKNLFLHFQKDFSQEHLQKVVTTHKRIISKLMRARGRTARALQYTCMDGWMDGWMYNSYTKNLYSKPPGAQGEASATFFEFFLLSP